MRKHKKEVFVFPKNWIHSTTLHSLPRVWLKFIQNEFQYVARLSLHLVAQCFLSPLFSTVGLHLLFNDVLVIVMTHCVAFLLCRKLVTFKSWTMAPHISTCFVYGFTTIFSYASCHMIVTKCQMEINVFSDRQVPSTSTSYSWVVLKRVRSSLSSKWFIVIAYT